MGLRKIVFFIESPFNQRDYDRFGFDVLSRNEFQVEVFDFTPFLHPRVEEKIKVPDLIHFPGLTRFQTCHEACQAIMGLRPDVFVMNLVSFGPKSFRIHQALSQAGNHYAVTGNNTIPQPSRTRSQRWVIFSRSFLQHPGRELRRRINWLHWLFKMKLGEPIRGGALLLAGGGESIQGHNYLCDERTEILWAHTLDYDLYMEEKMQHPGGRKEKIGVFLDEYLPFHPDYLHLNIKSPSTAHDYYPQLNRLFSFLEKIFSVSIEIAAHPRSHYEKHPEYFGHRKIVRGKTLQMVKKAGFVITHMSTAINFAVLYRKPVIFVTTHKLDHSYMGPHIQAMAEWLGKKPINVNEPLEPVDWASELQTKDEYYDNYKEAFIKTRGSEEKPVWQIMANRLKTFDE